MSQVAVVVRRMFAEAEATFTTEAADLASALAAAHTLAGIDARAVSGVGIAGASSSRAEAIAAVREAADKPAADPKPEKPKARGEAKKSEATPSTGTTNESAASAAQSGTGESTGEEVTYDGHVKPAILTIASKKGRDTVTALLQRYGAGKGPDLTPEQYADFHRDAQRVLAGEYDPTKADEEALA
jgi:hypothetical protein